MRNAEFGMRSYRFRPRAVLIEETQIAVSWFASSNKSETFVALTISASTKSSIQNADSSVSSSTIPIFAIKSAFDLARHAAR